MISTIHRRICQATGNLPSYQYLSWTPIASLMTAMAWMILKTIALLLMILLCTAYVRVARSTRQRVQERTSLFLGGGCAGSPVLALRIN